MNNRLALTVVGVGALWLGGCARLSPPTSSAADAQAAQQALIAYFVHLHAGRYLEASQLYGGSYEIPISHNDDIDPNDHVALLHSACTINGAQCLEVLSASLNSQPSANVFTFKVQFRNDDGSLFVRGPCCGASTTDEPPLDIFDFTVVKTRDGQFLVSDLPVYVP